jgi:hypothetical protein
MGRKKIISRQEIAEKILRGIQLTGVATNLKTKSKDLELLPLINFLEKLTVKNVHQESIENLLTQEEVIAFSKIENLREKVYIYYAIKNSLD